MAKQATIPKTIYYKRVTISDTNKTLQVLLAQAFNQCKKAAEREEVVNESENIIELINRFTEHNGMLFGQMVIFAHDTDHQLIQLDSNAESYDIQQLKPPKGKGGKAEGICQFYTLFWSYG